MICHQHDFLFVHIPKTGGQSIAHVVLEHLGLGWEDRGELLMRHNSDPMKGPERLAHLTAREYIQHSYLSPEDFERLFKFSVVRNPWDRLVSEYRYRGYSQRFTFPEFVASGLPPEGWGDAYRHVIPQAEFVLDEHGAVLVDRIVRFEELASELPPLLCSLGIPIEELPVVNQSLADGRASERHAPPRYEDYYDDTTRSRVQELYRVDIETFGYTFGE